MPNVIEITDYDAPELDIYARLTEAQLRNRLEPEKGVFIAESPKVILRALDAGYEPLSLLTLPEPAAEFRNWWQFRPNLAGSNDNFKSWPSLNMTIAAMMFSLPLLADVTKNRSKKRNIGCFVFACLYVAAYGYNRIHMTNHFLSDVCFGVLITLVIFMAVSKAFLRAAEN